MKGRRGKNGLPRNSEDVGAGIVLLSEILLGELILNFCSVGVPVVLAGSDLPSSMCLILLESTSVDPYETRVDSCVGKESEDLRRALKSSFLSVRSRRTVYGFSFPRLKLSSISGDVGIFFKSVTSL